MENGDPSLGLEDGTIDVEDLLVEPPQDGHLSMDNVICFDEKIAKNAMAIVPVSCSSGGSDTGIAREGEDILNGEVLNAMPIEAEDGYFRLENDFCNMGDEYLLGVEFAESITNLDYGSSEGLQAFASDCQIQVSTDGSDTGCRSDLYRTGDLRKCQTTQKAESSKFGCTLIRRGCETLDEGNPTVSPRSCSLQNSGKSRNSSSSSFLEVLSDENDGTFSLADKMFYSSKTIRNDEIELTGQNDATNAIEGQQIVATSSVQESSSNVLAQKRSRKPTQRYIDGLADPIPTYSKRKREASSSTIKDKSLGGKERRKCHVGPKPIKVPPEDPEEFSVIAIQVPFGSLANQERSESQSFDTVQHVDCRNSVTKSKGKYATPNNKSDNCVPALEYKKRGDCAEAPSRKRGDCGMGQKKTDAFVTESPSKKKNARAAATNQKKRNDLALAVIRKKRDDCFTTESPKKRDDRRLAVVHHKKRDETLTDESSEEASGRRKHHRLWTISEVRKLIEGVSQYGVGRWSRIKKLFFAASAHRTSVDLKDKWRNLLKASGMQEQGSQQGEKKRNVAWRPLPKPILRRVCELATMHPYPKGERGATKAAARDSTDITLSDYRRILSSVNGN
ncbi:telomeric repeat-binding factor 2-like isoform X1 [Salvia splendens]|nr:telomeric repeat-binding factor 2-like isoform X1 [Salvia splendens]